MKTMASTNHLCVISLSYLQGSPVLPCTQSLWALFSVDLLTVELFILVVCVNMLHELLLALSGCPGGVFLEDAHTGIVKVITF